VKLFAEDGGRGRWELKTHQLLISRLYFFTGSREFDTQYATTGNPLRGRGIILNSHTDLGVVVRGSVVK
jgi:hypothetical protein